MVDERGVSEKAQIPSHDDLAQLAKAMDAPIPENNRWVFLPKTGECRQLTDEKGDLHPDAPTLDVVLGIDRSAG